ncbi:MAG: aldo/keto reductase [Candidatus Thorarchaeota archaeon]
MKKMNLGDSGEKVSCMCLGTMYFGTKQNDQESFKLLDVYYEVGGRFLDTANNYAWWIEGGTGDDSEVTVGKWIKERDNREDIFLATKVGARLLNYSEGKDWTKCLEGLKRDTILTAIDQSLKRLQTDYIDLYYAHVDDRNTPLEETLEVFDKLRESGKIKHIGCSNYHSWRLERAYNIAKENKYTNYCCIQQGHTYLPPRFGATLAAGVGEITSRELLDYCRNNRNITIVAYSPLLQGVYSGRPDKSIPEEYRTVFTESKLKKLKDVADDHQATPNQVVLAWMMQSDPVIIPIIAASTEKQLIENLGAINVSLSAIDIDILSST